MQGKHSFEFTAMTYVTTIGLIFICIAKVYKSNFVSMTWLCVKMQQIGVGAIEICCSLYYH